MSVARPSVVQGSVSEGFEAVREAFGDNFIRRNELGAACSIYCQGEKVVDLWGGIRNKATEEPWEEDTMVNVFSTAKGMSSLAIALAHSRGYRDHEERVCEYWPEFALLGKGEVTVRQLLAHQAGLLPLDAHVDRQVVADLDRLADALAAQKPAWKPGTREAYHGISLGFYEGELLRRIDPNHRSLGQFFQEEIAIPLGPDFYIRLPESIPSSRWATVQAPDLVQVVLHPDRFVVANLNPWSPTHRAFWSNSGEQSPSTRSRNLEVPSQGGVGTARAIARAHSDFATGGRELGLQRQTLVARMASAVPPRYGFFDECLKIEWQLSLHFAKPDRHFPFGSAAPFGTPGAGGPIGFADPQREVGYAFVLNRLGRRQGDDPRELTVRKAFYESIGVSEPFAAAGIESVLGQRLLKFAVVMFGSV